MILVADDMITVGRLGRTRGIDGELFVHPETDFPERLTKLRRIFLSDGAGWEPVNVASARFVGDKVVLRFEGITTPEAAARYTNRWVAVGRDELVDLPEDTFFLFDLIGCTVEDEAGTVIGRIVQVEQYPANDAYEIELNSGQRVLFPAVRSFVRHVDVEQQRVVIDRAGLVAD